MEIRVIGCGAMGSALAKVLAKHGNSISLVDAHQQKAASLAHEINGHVFSNALENLPLNAILIIAVKPQDFSSIAEKLRDVQGNLIVSVMAGISTKKLRDSFPHAQTLRMLPNLAVEYGKGIAALVDDPQQNLPKEKIEKVFSPLGVVKWIPENLADATISLAGSGPAFVFALIESMIEAAIAMGLSADIGEAFAKQMISGAIAQLDASGKHPAELKWKVASPGGTTIAGLRKMEEKGVRSGLIETFIATYERSKNLG